MLPATFLAYAALGCVAGLLSGALGLGGGVVIVPALLLTLPALGLATDMAAHLAVATSLATIAVTSLSAIRTHHQHGFLRWPLALRLAAGIIAGAFAGALLASHMPGAWLAGLFGVFAMLIAVQMAFASAPARVERAAEAERLPGTAGLVTAGALIGLVSGVFGIGGGSVTVPWLSWCRVRMQEAVAVSAAGGFPIAVGGCTGFIISGWNQPGLPAGSLGYVYLPAAAAIVLTSFPFAWLGARAAHRLPSRSLKRIFALILFLIGLRLVLA